MMAQRIILGTLTGCALSTMLLLAAPAQALTMKECSAKYKAAQTANTLNGMKWNDFRKAQCGEDAAATPAAATAPAPAATAAAAPAAVPAGTVLPKALSPKYASEKPAKARMHTCLDQYKANKAAGGAGNGGMRWIEKGGGYYSVCNRGLKG